MEVKIKKDICKGCQLCVFNCPAKHLELASSINKKGVPFAQVKSQTKCTGCGCCFYICPEQCIEILK